MADKGESVPNIIGNHEVLIGSNQPLQLDPTLVAANQPPRFNFG